jgi:hypothetical protein
VYGIDVKIVRKMTERKVVASYPVKCNGPEGVLLRKNVPPVEASITVFDDGTREVGCGYLGFNRTTNGDNCSSGVNIPCPHLKPQIIIKCYTSPNK